MFWYARAISPVRSCAVKMCNTILRNNFKRFMYRKHFSYPKQHQEKATTSKKQRGPNTLGNFTIAYHIWTPQVFSKKCNEFDNKYIQNRHSSVKRSWLYNGCVSIPLFQYFHSLAPRWQPSIFPSTLFFVFVNLPSMFQVAIFELR